MLIDGRAYYLRHRASGFFLDGDVSGDNVYLKPFDEDYPDKQVWIARQKDKDKSAFYLVRKINNDYLAANNATDSSSEVSQESHPDDNDYFTIIRYKEEGVYVGVRHHGTKAMLNAATSSSGSSIPVTKEPVGDVLNQSQLWELFSVEDFVLQVNVISITYTNVKYPAIFDQILLTQGKINNQTYATVESNVEVQRAVEESSTWSFSSNSVFSSESTFDLTGVFFKGILTMGFSETITFSSSITKENSMIQTESKAYNYSTKVSVPTFTNLVYKGYLNYSPSTTAQFQMLLEISGKIGDMVLTGKQIKQAIKSNNLDWSEENSSTTSDSLLVKEGGTFSGAHGVDLFLDLMLVDPTINKCQIFNGSLYIGVSDSNPTPKAAAVGYVENNETTDWWLKREDGYYRIQNVKTGLFLMMDTDLQIKQDTHSVNDGRQLWILPPGNAGCIQNANAAMQTLAIAPKDNSNLNNTPLFGGVPSATNPSMQWQLKPS